MSERDMVNDVTDAMAQGGIWFAAFLQGKTGWRVSCDDNPDGWPLPPGYDIVLLGTAPLPGDAGFNLIRVKGQAAASPVVEQVAV